MKKEALDSITKISQINLDRIAKLKMSGYEPNDYVIGLALSLLEKENIQGKFEKTKLNRTTKISKRTLERISSLKMSGYEPNDFIISRALDLLEKERGVE